MIVDNNLINSKAGRYDQPIKSFFKVIGRDYQCPSQYAPGVLNPDDPD
jgi:hypothetical protein